MKQKNGKYQVNQKYQDGTTFKGQMYNQVVVGEGTLKNHNIGTFKGYFKNNAAYYGTYQTKHGIYSGQWLNNQRHGIGDQVYSNGDIFSGKFINNQKKSGLYRFYQGKAEFKGDFSNNLPHGRGKISFQSGDTFEGMFKNGNFDYGIYTWKKGEILQYQGRFSNNKKHGEGHLIFKNGLRFKGFFKQGKLHGSGNFTTPKGQEHTVVYQDGYLLFGKQPQ